MNFNPNNPLHAERYSRHLLLENFTGKTQENIAKAKVAIVGAGGLGSNAALQLAACGVGHLVLIDCDAVEISNLPRQLCYSENEVGKTKAHALAHRLQRRNSGTKFTAHHHRFTASSAPLFNGVDVVVDGLDTMSDKFLLNDMAASLQLPLVYGGVVGMEGAALTIANHPSVAHSPCLRCAFPHAREEERNCATLGVYAPLCFLLAGIQASETLKLLKYLPSKHRNNTRNENNKNNSNANTHNENNASSAPGANNADNVANVNNGYAHSNYALHNRNCNDHYQNNEREVKDKGKLAQKLNSSPPSFAGKNREEKPLRKNVFEENILEDEEKSCLENDTLIGKLLTINGNNYRFKKIRLRQQCVHGQK